MNAARELVGHFSSSSQAEEILLSKQIRVLQSSVFKM
jgi:hypothetical protein